jgi:ABC-type siderophore export system fused ATPase/permease subunit
VKGNLVDFHSESELAMISSEMLRAIVVVVVVMVVVTFFLLQMEQDYFSSL